MIPSAVCKTLEPVMPDALPFKGPDDPFGNGIALRIADEVKARSNPSHRASFMKRWAVF